MPGWTGRGAGRCGLGAGKGGETPATAAAIAVVGPLTNAVIAIVCLVASTVLGSGIPGLVLGGIAFVNGALAVLNLLPGLPLDGGQGSQLAASPEHDGGVTHKTLQPLRKVGETRIGDPHDVDHGASP